jgi:hypothetical protein
LKSKRIPFLSETIFSPSKTNSPLTNVELILFEKVTPSKGDHPHLYSKLDLTTSVV